MNQHNLQALSFSTGEFSFARNATSASDAQARGYYDFGNIVAASIAPELEKLEHKGSYRGIRRTDRTVMTETKLQYQIKVDELDREKLLFAVLGTATTNHSQAELTADDGADLEFSEVPAVPGKWYDLKTIAGARVRNVTTVTFATLTEGEDEDFVVDKRLGRVRFTSPISSDLTPVITAPAIATADGMKGIDPLTNTIQRGYGRLSLFDDAHPDKLIYDHVDFSCEISFESMNEQDGQNFGEITLNVLVTDQPGKVYTAE